jgi:hypothetical protein
VFASEEVLDLSTTYQDSYTFKDGSTHDVGVKLEFKDQAGKIASDAHSAFMKKAIRFASENSVQNPSSEEGRKALEAEIKVQLNYTKFTFKSIELLPNPNTTKAKK